MDNKTLRNQAYDNGTPAQQYLCGHPDSGIKMMTIASQYGLSEESTYKNFVLLVGDIVLGLKPADNISTLLTQELSLNAETAALLSTAIIDFMKPLRDPIWQPPSEDDVSNTVIELQTEIAEAEAFLQTTPPLRTMATDSKQIGYSSTEENTYTSHQSAIINEGKN